MIFDTDRAYKILGVYHVTRSESFDQFEKGRKHTSLGIRLRGDSRLISKNREITVGKGNVVYIPSGVDYRRKTDVEEELIILHLTCYGKDHDDIFSIDCAKSENLFWQLLAAWDSEQKENYNRCMSILYRIFETLEREQSFERTSSLSAIMHGVEYLQRCYRDPSLSVSRLAELSHVSEVYFRRVYHKAYGESPWQTVLNLRFAYAADYLRSGYYSVKEVAAQSGFSDVKYFRTAFSKRYGCTPNVYAARISADKDIKE